jgi:hypothetical protein
MPMVYTTSPATAGNTATNAGANTESDVIYFIAGTRNFALQAMYLIGKAAGLTAISGIAIRIVKFTTPSTTGTAATPAPKDVGMQASKHTAKTGGTAGSTRTQHAIFGCGAAGPGGWVAPNPDSVILLEGSSAPSLDALSVSGTASLNFEFTTETVE